MSSIYFLSTEFFKTLCFGNVYLQNLTKELGMLSKNVCNKLISGLKCSKCSRKFDENSVRVMRFDDGLFVLRVTCENCSKSFGLAFLGLNEEEIMNSVSNFTKEPEPISFDDVIDAHKYIQNLDENWKNFVRNFDT